MRQRSDLAYRISIVTQEASHRRSEPFPLAKYFQDIDSKEKHQGDDDPLKAFGGAIALEF